MMDKTQNFTEGKIFSPLIRFALPVLLALFLQAMYGAVDLFVVGQFGGTFADVYVSAVSTGSQIMHTITIGLFGIISVVLTIVVILFSSQLAQLMQAPKEAFSDTVYYIVICSAGSIFIVAYNLVGSIFR